MQDFLKEGYKLSILKQLKILLFLMDLIDLIKDNFDAFYTLNKVFLKIVASEYVVIKDIDRLKNEIFLRKLQFYSDQIHFFQELWHFDNTLVSLRCCQNLSSCEFM